MALLLPFHVNKMNENLLKILVYFDMNFFVVVIAAGLSFLFIHAVLFDIDDRLKLVDSNKCGFVVRISNMPIWLDCKNCLCLNFTSQQRYKDVVQFEHKETQFVDIEKAYDDDDEGLFAERKACGKMYTFYRFSLNTRISRLLPLSDTSFFIS